MNEQNADEKLPGVYITSGTVHGKINGTALELIKNSTGLNSNIHVKRDVLIIVDISYPEHCYLSR